MKRILSRIVLATLVGLVSFEVACQVYAAVLRKQWDVLKRDPAHIYRGSANAALGYELRPGYEVARKGRRCRIDSDGLRVVEPDARDARRTVAILGDSVVFGTDCDQPVTLPSLLQETLVRAGAEVKVLNLGVPGYGVDEILAGFRERSGAHRVDHAVYVLNLNDFCRRNTVYEGADNGLYRLYHMPFLKSPWFVRKAVYRWHKGGELVSVEWYRWMFRGNAERAIEKVAEMSKVAEAHGARFAVVVLPAGCAYRDGLYLLADIHDAIRSDLQALGIDVIDARNAFTLRAGDAFDITDHLTVEGNRIMAGILASLLQTARRTDA